LHTNTRFGVRYTLNELCCQVTWTSIVCAKRYVKSVQHYHCDYRFYSSNGSRSSNTLRTCDIPTLAVITGVCMYVHCVWNVSIDGFRIILTSSHVSEVPVRKKKKKYDRETCLNWDCTTYCAFLQLLWTPPEIINDLYFNVMEYSVSPKSRKNFVFLNCRLPTLRVVPANVEKSQSFTCKFSSRSGCTNKQRD